jgi:hypothetical protein
MCLSSIVRRNSYSPQNIDADGYGLKVLRIDAPSIPTKVVKRQSAGNWAFFKFIHSAMR